MAQKLSGKRVAILATHGFEQSELLEPRDALRNEGAEVTVVSLASGEIRGWSGEEWGRSVHVDQLVSNVRAEDFDALQLPGGVMNPDKLRTSPEAVNFVRAFFEAGKPVAAICHGPWLLAEADVVQGRRVTSWPSLRTDLENAGANWVDEEVVVDKGLVTSRKPADLPAFNQKMIEEVAEGIHNRTNAATLR